MKLLIPLIIFTALSTNAHAHPGSNTLECKSAAQSGAKQQIEVFLKRGNAIGMYAPTIEVSIDGKKYVVNTPLDTSNYGSTFHNSPLKVITVSAASPYTGKGISGQFSVVALPDTIQTTGYDDAPAQPWTIEAQREGCFDAFGKATFKGYIEGSLYSDKNHVEVETQVLDCELSYNPGMAC